MSKQLSVQSQNDRTRARIEEVASWFTQSNSPAPWLIELLVDRGVPPDAGILVQFAETPEQDGNLCKGIWLSESRRFWSFEAVVPRTGSSAVTVEYFRDITSEFSLDAHLPGVGKSFGCLAVEVLDSGVVG